jgi:hypothetical protein
VSAWQFADEIALLKAVLRAYIDALSAAGPTLSLRGLPTSYAAAIATTTPRLADLVRSISHAPSEPEIILAKAEDLAATMGVRACVWIDDTERFADASHRLTRPLEALLALIREHTHLSFVLAHGGSTKQPLVDTAKIATDDFRISKPNPHDVSRIIHEAMKNVYQTQPWHDPRRFSDGEQPRPFASDKGHSDVILYYLSTTGLTGAITELLRNPRILKRCLRRTLKKWARLTGEVDPGELLCIEALRASGVAFPSDDPHYPSLSAYDYIQRHADMLRNPDPESSTYSPSAKAAIQKASNSLDRLPEPAITIIRTLFPRYSTGHPRSFLPRHPQAVNSTAYSDYLARIVNGQIGPNESSDTDIIRLLHELDDKSKPLTRGTETDNNGPHHLIRLLNGEHRRKVEQFCHCVSPQIWHELLSNIYDLLHPEVFSRDDDSHPEALISLARVLQYRHDLHRPAISGVLSAIPIALRQDLYLLHALQYWLLPEHGVESVREAERLERQELLEIAKSNESVVQFANAIAPENPHALAWTIRRGWGRDKAVRDLSTIHELRPLSAPLLHVAKSSRERLLLPITLLVSTSKDTRIQDGDETVDVRQHSIDKSFLRMFVPPADRSSPGASRRDWLEFLATATDHDPASLPSSRWYNFSELLHQVATEAKSILSAYGVDH